MFFELAFSSQVLLILAIFLMRSVYFLVSYALPLWVLYTECINGDLIIIIFFLYINAN